MRSNALSKRTAARSTRTRRARFEVALFLPTTRLARVEACLDNQNPAFSAHSSPRRSLPPSSAVSDQTPLDRGKPGRDRKSTRLNSSHIQKSRMPSSA